MDMAGGLMDSFIVKILIASIIGVAVLLAVVGASYWTYTQMIQGTQVEEEDDELGQTTEPLQTHQLGNEFIITKRGDDGSLTIRASITFAYDSQNQQVVQELKNRSDQIRSRIFRVLGEKSAEELQYRNLENLEEEIRSEVNELLTSGFRIQAVYMRDYVVQ